MRSVPEDSNQVRLIEAQQAFADQRAALTSSFDEFGRVVFSHNQDFLFGVLHLDYWQAFYDVGKHALRATRLMGVEILAERKYQKLSKSLGKVAVLQPNIPTEDIDSEQKAA